MDDGVGGQLVEIAHSPGYVEGGSQPEGRLQNPERESLEGGLAGRRPLLLVDDGEQRSVLCELRHYGELLEREKGRRRRRKRRTHALVVEGRPDEGDDVGVGETGQYGDLPAEHVHLRLASVGHGTVPLYGHYPSAVRASVDLPERARADGFLCGAREGPGATHLEVDLSQGDVGLGAESPAQLEDLGLLLGHRVEAAHRRG